MRSTKSICHTEMFSTFLVLNMQSLAMAASIRNASTGTLIAVMQVLVLPHFFTPCDQLFSTSPLFAPHIFLNASIPSHSILFFHYQTFHVGIQHTG